ncbi:hypothetical protein GCM10007301_31120 [Azorhizobium oxalatiphilum]|uniref:Uncharacterized protein n=1 Tax=Azorhizobium oxalatiphilum TaxID=980631 RepID=A0A917C4Y7_9HYPH|nr:hypothetical protein [Azorhizobium oxalatiphilum]GGF69204.1 hypothetical protein GCM10007301_31120 [Azorhizobium oxalatiphilum]
MTFKTTLLAVTTAALLGAASTSAFAMPHDGLQTAQYSDWQQTLPAPRFTAAKLHTQALQSGVGNLIGPADPHSGPAFDPDVE